jgi:hypothetical protein
MFRYWRIGSRTERVRSVTLDALFAAASIDRVRLVKVDCEGAEGLVVKGATRVLSDQRIDFVAMEYHESICGPDACKDAHARLVDAGYTQTTLFGQCLYHLPSCAHDLDCLSNHAY